MSETKLEFRGVASESDNGGTVIGSGLMGVRVHDINIDYGDEPYLKAGECYHIIVIIKDISNDDQ
jgi:hypothetical protein